MFIWFYFTNAFFIFVFIEILGFTEYATYFYYAYIFLFFGCVTLDLFIRWFDFYRSSPHSIVNQTIILVLGLTLIFTLFSDQAFCMKAGSVAPSGTYIQVRTDNYLFGKIWYGYSIQEQFIPDPVQPPKDDETLGEFLRKEVPKNVIKDGTIMATMGTLNLASQKAQDIAAKNAADKLAAELLAKNARNEANMSLFSKFLKKVGSTKLFAKKAAHIPLTIVGTLLGKKIWDSSQDQQRILATQVELLKEAQLRAPTLQEKLQLQAQVDTATKNLRMQEAQIAELQSQMKSQIDAQNESIQKIDAGELFVPSELRKILALPDSDPKKKALMEILTDSTDSEFGAGLALSPKSDVMPSSPIEHFVFNDGNGITEFICDTFLQVTEHVLSSPGFLTLNLLEFIFFIFLIRFCVNKISNFFFKSLKGVKLFLMDLFLWVILITVLAPYKPLLWLTTVYPEHWLFNNFIIKIINSSPMCWDPQVLVIFLLWSCAYVVLIRLLKK